jgi:hypothetical protein
LIGVTTESYHTDDAGLQRRSIIAAATAQIKLA